MKKLVISVILIVFGICVEAQSHTFTYVTTQKFIGTTPMNKMSRSDITFMVSNVGGGKYNIKFWDRKSKNPTVYQFNVIYISPGSGSYVYSKTTDLTACDVITDTKLSDMAKGTGGKIMIVLNNRTKESMMYILY